MIPVLLGPLDIQPVLLHGDLWVCIPFTVGRQYVHLLYVLAFRSETQGQTRSQVNLSSLTLRPTTVIMKQSQSPPLGLFCSAQGVRSLAIARIFGGFPKPFFRTYHQHLHKSDPVDQYELRGDLYELFHYLNHTVLFGVSIQGLLNFHLNNQGWYRGDTLRAACSR